MPNIFDYLDWRGDLSFASAPFCEVDNLILAELSFIDFKDVVSGKPGKSIKLSDAVTALSDYREEDAVETGLLLPKDLFPLLKRAAKCERFRDIRLAAFESRTDTGCEAQFAAVTMLLPDGTAFVSFRGTDDTLVGWKEDLNMSFLSVVPSQSYAANYLARIAAVYPYKLRIGGHSKGGNLSVYAAASVPKRIQRRILAVYNNDGPGFSRSFLDSEGYERISGRVHTIVPQTSIIGMLLEHEGSFTIVKSTQNGILQHDGFSWEVYGASFVRVEDFTEESRIIDKTLKAWIADLDPKSREEFVDALYEILSAASAHTLSDIGENREALGKIVKSITPEHRAILKSTLFTLYRAWQRIDAEKREARREERRIDKARETEERAKRKEAAERARREKKSQNGTAHPIRPIRFRSVKAVRTPQSLSKHPPHESAVTAGSTEKSDAETAENS